MGAALASVALLTGLSVLHSGVPGLSGLRRVVVTLGSAVLAGLALIGLNAPMPQRLIVIGTVLFLGIPVLSSVAGIDPRAMASNFWVWILLLATIAIGGMGAGFGSFVGRHVGKVRTERFQLPAIRSALPEDLKQTAEANEHHA